MILVLKNNGFIMFEGDINSLPSDVAGCPAVEFKRFDYERTFFYNQINLGNWTIGKYGSLKDCRQEAREVSSPEKVLEITKNFSSWLEYDADQLDKKIGSISFEKKSLERECSFLKEELSKMKDSLNEIYDVMKSIFKANESGDADSRKKIRELVLKYITVCDVCNEIDCICGKK